MSYYINDTMSISSDPYARPEARAILDGVVDLSRRPVSAEERARAVAVRPASRPTASDAAKSDLKVDEDRRD